MKRKLAVAQGTVMRLLQAAEQAGRARDYAQAVELAERAQRLDPADVNILLFLGQLHQRNHDLTKAEAVYERAVRLSPRPTQTLLEAGQRACAGSHWELGQKFFAQAAARPEATAEVFAALAGALERLRKNDEALARAEQAVKKDPACGEALLIQARLRRQSGDLAGAESQLRTHLPQMGKATRAKAAYELGSILDKQGRYDEAMSAFLEAKGLLQADAKQPVYELKVMRDRLKTLREALNADVFARWSRTAAELTPARRIALLGGHPRSGTTLLEQVVDTHADVISAEETELFHDDAYQTLARGHADENKMFEILDSAATERLQSARSNYIRRAEQFLKQPLAGRLLVDKNPSVTFLIPAFVRVFPEAKFLIALRDPRDICLSCFMQSISMSQSGAAWLSLDSTVREYADLMTMWRTVRPWVAAQAIEVRYEDMVADLPAVARRTLEFLQLPWDERVLGFDAHARQKTVRSPTYAEVIKPVFKTAVGRWRNYQKYLEPHLAVLEPFVKELGYE